MFCCHSLKRPAHFLPAEIPSMVDNHQKRIRRFYHELVHASGHTPHSIGTEGALRRKPIFFLDLCAAVKNGRARQAPVYDFRRAAPWFFLSALYLRAVCRCVCWFRPYNRPPVMPGNQEKPLSRCWRSIIRGHKFAPLDGISQVFKLLQPFVESLAHQFFDRLSFSHRPPRLELLHVLQNNHARTDRSGPAQDDPCKPAYIFVNRFPTLGLAEMLAIRGEPGQAHGAPLADFHRVHVPHAGLKMARVRVVRLVH